MNLRCCWWQILLAVWYFKAENKNNQVEAKDHTRTLKHWGSDQILSNLSKSVEIKIHKEHPKFRVKRLKKKKKKLRRRKGETKNKLIATNSIFPKHRSKSQRKRKKGFKKFVKTVSDRNKDSNMSASKEFDAEDKPVDIIVHIKMNNN
ncbi:unnamed protein product, partial [Iphiclides podalirius]